MPLPTVKSLALSSNILTGYALDIANESRDYISDMIPPINKGDMVEMRDGAAFAGSIMRTKIASNFLDGTKESNLQVEWGEELPMFEGVQFDPLNWRAKKFGCQGKIPREFYLVSEARRTNNVRYCLGPVVEQVKQARELQLLTVIKGWSNNTALTYDWTTANGNPSKDILAAVNQVAKYRDPDTVIMGFEAAAACIGNSTWRAEMPTTMFRQGMPIDEMAEVIRSRIGVRNVLISRARYNSSTNGTPSINGIMGDRCWVGRLDLVPSLQAEDAEAVNDLAPRTSYELRDGSVAQIGSDFAVTSAAFVRIVPEDLRVNAWYDDGDETVHFSCSCHQDVQVAYAELGYLITNCA